MQGHPPFPPNQATREHVRPRSAGGHSRQDNLELACRRCNSRRGSHRNWVAFHDETWRLGPPLTVLQQDTIRFMRQRFEHLKPNRKGELIRHGSEPRRRR